MPPKSITTFIKGVLILAPPLLIGLLIFKNGVDFPVLDEWDGTAPLFEKMTDGSLGVGDFFAQHNEHRIFFPRLIFFALGRLTHWDVRAELWVIWLLTLICLFNIWRIARSFPSAFWLLFPASVLLFSPQSVANFLWGFQVGFLLPLACVTACIWVAAYLRYPFNFLLAMILCTICTFSIGGGFTSWLLTTPLLLLAQLQSTSPASRKWWAAWVSLFWVELLLYFWDYQKPPNHPPVWWFIGHPILAAEYILLFFGGPFSRGTNLPPIPVGLSMGALLLIMLLVVAFYIWKKRSDRSLLREPLPWLVLAMVTVNYAILVMIGRAGLGPGQARAPRYLPFAVMLPIALLALGRLIYTHWARSGFIRGRWVAKAILAASILPLIFFTGAGFLGGLPFWPMNRQLGAYRKTLVTFINVVPETDQLTESVFPWPDRVKTAVNVLDRIGYWRPPLMRSNVIRSQTEFGTESSAKTESGNATLGNVVNGTNGDAAFGTFQFNEEAAGAIAAKGSAFLPDERRPADAVLITIDNAASGGKPEICAIARIGDPHHVARLRAVWDSSALPSTWNCRFSREGLPQEQHYYLEAWAFKVETLQAYRLQGNAFFLR